MNDLGLKPADFRGAEDLVKLPVISKEQLRASPSQFQSTAIDTRQTIALKTGGSTGAYCSVLFDPPALLLNLASASREMDPILRATGRRTSLELRVAAAITPHGSTQALQTFYRSQYLLPVRPRVFSIFDPIEKNISRLSAYRPDIFASYGSYLSMLFQLYFEGKIEFHLPRAIVYGGDHFSVSLKGRVEQELGIPVFSCYGASEVPRIGFTCEGRSGFHVHADLCHVSSRPGPGGADELIVSNLTNRATVLLNYRLGDLGKLSDSSCRCGRVFPLLETVVGRLEDVIRLPSGKFVHPYNFHNIVQSRRDVLDYQVVQVDSSSFVIRVVLSDDSDFDESRQALLQACGRLFGLGVTIDVEHVGRLATLSNGKVRRVTALKPD